MGACRPPASRLRCRSLGKCSEAVVAGRPFLVGWPAMASVQTDHVELNSIAHKSARRRSHPVPQPWDLVNRLWHHLAAGGRHLDPRADRWDRSSRPLDGISPEQRPGRWNAARVRQSDRRLGSHHHRTGGAPYVPGTEIRVKRLIRTPSTPMSARRALWSIADRRTFSGNCDTAVIRRPVWTSRGAAIVLRNWSGPGI